MTKPAKPAKPVKPAKTDWFVHDRFGMFIHWGLYSMGARQEWLKRTEKFSDEGYQKYFDRFNPDLYNPKDWARIAKDAGMKYLVITTKHHEGFCLWDSKYTDYNATKTPCGKDLLKPLVEAFRNEGLRIGFYYSLLDWHHPDFTVDHAHPMAENEEERKKNSRRDMRKYAEYMRNQVTELLTEFGEISLLWFDFTYARGDGKTTEDWESEKLVRLVRRLQPNIMINNRLDLPGAADFETPEQVQPLEEVKGSDGKPLLWEVCQTFSGCWGYNRDEQSWREPDELLRALIDSVSKNGNLLLNVGPTSRGEIDYRAQDRLAFFAEWMKRHSRSIYGCTQAPPEFQCPPGCGLTFNPVTNCLYLHILVWPYKRLTLSGKAYMDRVEYAQFLHDGSEVRLQGLVEWQVAVVNSKVGKGEGSINLSLPQTKPKAAVPVVELFLK